jgi:hypothetical protein
LFWAEVKEADAIINELSEIPPILAKFNGLWQKIIHYSIPASSEI